MSAKAYETSLNIINLSDQICKTTSDLFNDIGNHKEISELIKNGIILEFLSNQLLNESQCLESIIIKNKVIQDENINRTATSVRTLSDGIKYFSSMAIAILQSKITRYIEDLSNNDIKRYCKLIIESLDGLNSYVTSIKYSDYCYVERGLLKKEEIYPELCGKE